MIPPYIYKDIPYLISILLTILIVVLTIRLSTCLPQYREGAKDSQGKKKSTSVKTIVFFGSGGHTTEMLRLINKLDKEKYRPIYFVTSHSDTTSKDKIDSAKLSIERNAIWESIYRSREVKQSWISTIFTTLYSVLQSFILVLKITPELIICNGPGTCVVICYSAFLLRILGICQPTIIYVESFCRVKTLSLSGKLLYPIADKFIVQWPELTLKYSRADYLGRIC